MRKILLLLALVIVAAAPPSSAATENRRCVFSIVIVHDGGGASRPGDTRVGDGLFLYEYAGGWITGERREAWHGLFGPAQEPVTDLFGGGPEFTAAIRAIFRQSQLHGIDFGAAVAAARQQAAVDGKIMALVGPRTVEVSADLEGTHFSLTAEGLGAELDFFSPYSPELRRLKSLLDAIALEYGRHRVFL